MTRFLITVLNQTGSDQHYLLFASAPRVLEPPAAPTFANIFIAAPVTQHKGNAIFKLTSVPYAVCGEATTNLGSGANVAVCNSYEIKVGNKATGTLGTDIEVILDSEASAEFNTQDVKTTEVVGYSIAAPNYNLPDSSKHLHILSSKDVQSKNLTRSYGRTQVRRVRRWSRPEWNPATCNSANAPWHQIYHRTPPCVYRRHRIVPAWRHHWCRYHRPNNFDRFRNQCVQSHYHPGRKLGVHNCSMITPCFCRNDRMVVFWG